MVGGLWWGASARSVAQLTHPHGDNQAMQTLDTLDTPAAVPRHTKPRSLLSHGNPT
jgi:hypothetical protein